MARYCGSSLPLTLAKRIKNEKSGTIFRTDLSGEVVTVKLLRGRERNTWD